MDIPESGQSHLGDRTHARHAIDRRLACPQRRVGGNPARHGIRRRRVRAGQQLPVVTAAKPVVREIVEDDEFVGRFEAVDEVAIRSRVSGYLDEVHFQDGALVNKGDLLFTIDQRPYQAAYDAAKSQVDVAEQPARIHQGAAASAPKSSPSPAIIPISTLDDRRREYLVGAGAARRAPRRRCATASLDLEFTEIRAPLAGRIDRRLVSVGNLVQPDHDPADHDRGARSDRLLFRRR